MCDVNKHRREYFYELLTVIEGVLPEALSMAKSMRAKGHRCSCKGAKCYMIVSQL